MYRDGKRLVTCQHYEFWYFTVGMYGDICPRHGYDCLYAPSRAEKISGFCPGCSAPVLLDYEEGRSTEDDLWCPACWDNPNRNDGLCTLDDLRALGPRVCFVGGTGERCTARRHEGRGHGEVKHFPVDARYVAEVVWDERLRQTRSESWDRCPVAWLQSSPA